MSAHGLREIVNLPGEIDAVAFATIAFGSEERFRVTIRAIFGSPQTRQAI